MRHKTYFSLFAPALSLLRRRGFPPFISWNLTFKCSRDCLYCGASLATGPELDASGVMEGLDELWRLGARWITFGGGEPLSRPDIEKILGHAAGLGFRVFLSTNGGGAAAKSAALKHVSHVNLSLDGERAVNDKIRGEGSYDEAVAAIKVCRELGVPVSLLCLLSALNLDQAEKVLDLAAANGITVMFQPASLRRNSSVSENPIAPPPQAYRAAIERIIGLKRAGAPVRNSFAGLRQLAGWPDPVTVHCPAGSLAAVVEPDGTLTACHLEKSGLPAPRPFGHWAGGLGGGAPAACSGCCCAPLVELGLIRGLNLEAAWNALRMTLKDSRRSQ